MRYGFVFPSGEARTAAEFARAAELSGWDGFFVWEPVWGVDAWVSLAAAAMLTERIHLGTLLTPPSRIRPWKLASETATLDRLSNGRVILSIGLGALDSGFESFGEVTDRKTRAELLDEGLEILTGLWRGMPFQFQGKHYQIDVNKNNFHTPPPPPPVQSPRIPIWVVGAYGSKKSMRRALRYDGLLPNIIGEDGKVRMSPPTPEEIREIAAYIEANRIETAPYDIIVEGMTPGNNPTAADNIVSPYREAGATWWIESRWQPKDENEILDRIQHGPPDIQKIS